MFLCYAMLSIYDMYLNQNKSNGPALVIVFRHSAIRIKFEFSTTQSSQRQMVGDASATLPFSGALLDSFLLFPFFKVR